MPAPYRIALMSAGSGIRKKGRTTDWRVIPHTLFEWSLDGSWLLELKGRGPVNVPAGQVLVVPAGMEHRLTYTGRGEMTSHWRFVDLTDPENFPLPLELKKVPFFSKPLSLRLIRLLTPLRSGPDENQPIPFSRNQSALHRVMHLLFTDPDRTLGLANALRVPKLGPVFDYLKINWHREVSRKDLAGLVPLSEMRFHTLFQRETGFAPMKYLLNFRLQKVQELLLFSDRSLAEIADQTGFVTGYALSRAFRREMKMPPREYRKRLRVAYLLGGKKKSSRL